MDILWVSLKKIVDDRGQIIALESQDMAFEMKRIYCLTDLNDKPRGFHAHKELQQLMVCLSGSCKIMLDDGLEKSTLIISKKNDALFINKMVWHELFDFSPDCTLMFVVSAPYDETDYIRSYEQFRRAMHHDS